MYKFEKWGTHEKLKLFTNDKEKIFSASLQKKFAIRIIK